MAKHKRVQKNRDKQIPRGLIQVLAENCKRRRTHAIWGSEKKPLTQQDAADMAQITVRQYRRIETGKINCTLRMVEAIAKVYSIKPQRLLDENRSV